MRRMRRIRFGHRARERARGFGVTGSRGRIQWEGGVPEVGAVLSAARGDRGGDRRELHRASHGEGGLHPNRLARPGADGGLALDRRRSDARAGEAGDHHGRHFERAKRLRFSSGGA